MQSCIYRGQVSHRRFVPVRNAFRYRIFMLYLELGELPALLDRFWLWSARRPAPAWFRREDHAGDAAQPLESTIRDLVERESGQRPTGPIRLLTHLRYFGYCFNPLSVYYCFDADETLAAVVLEVSNMPWREMHCYVLSGGGKRHGDSHRYEFGKAFHVSPFLPLDMQYRCRLDRPEERLRFGLETRREDRKVFDAHLVLDRLPMTHGNMARMLALDPLITARVTSLIHWQALKLWVKRAPLFTHPARAGSAGNRTVT